LESPLEEWTSQRAVLHTNTHVNRQQSQAAEFTTTNLHDDGGTYKPLTQLGNYSSSEHINDTKTTPITQVNHNLTSQRHRSTTSSANTHFLFAHCTFDLAHFDFLDYRQYHYEFDIPWPQREVQLIKFGATTVNTIKDWGTENSVVLEDRVEEHWLCGFGKVRRVGVKDVRQNPGYKPADLDWRRPRIETLRHWFQDEQLEVDFESRVLQPLQMFHNIYCR
jgi:hypothetical protein